MPSVLILSLDDIGKQYRLLRHAKSFANQKDSSVILLGPDITSLPKFIENSPNIQLKYFYKFPKFPNVIVDILLFPIQLLYYLFHIYFLSKTLPKTDFVLSNLNLNIYQLLAISSFSFSFNAKIILDVQNLHWNNPILRRFERIFMSISSALVCSTQALKVLLRLSNFKPYLIYDPPGSIFKHETDIKSEVLSFLRRGPNTLLISVPFPYFDENLLKSFVDLSISLESFKVDISFVIQGNAKEQEKIEKMFTNSQEQNHIQLHFAPINSNLYSQILGCSDLCIVFDGSVNGLDFAPHITDAIGAKIPILVSRHGSMAEVTDRGKKGLIFKDEIELREYIVKLCITKEIDLNELKKNALKTASAWDISWQEFYSDLLKHCFC